MTSEELQKEKEDVESAMQENVRHVKQVQINDGCK